MNKQTFLYQFLIEPRYRIARHILLLAAVTAVSLNQNIYTFGARIEQLGNQVYLAGLCTLISYFIVGYLHLYLLVPRLLLKKKYQVYILCSSVSVLLLLLLRYVQEYWIFTSSGIPPVRGSYFNMVSILDSLSDYMLNMICITGISMTVLLKHWMTENQRVNQLERKQIQSEVDNLKEQVNPSLLFNTLNRTGVLSKSEPQKAADMVLRLSQLLRYQLYDGARDKVLLNSEINFLTHYLALEKFYSDTFDYQIVSDKALTGVLIPPPAACSDHPVCLEKNGETRKTPFHPVTSRPGRRRNTYHLPIRRSDRTGDERTGQLKGPPRSSLSGELFPIRHAGKDDRYKYHYIKNEYTWQLRQTI
ncbi:histidine kinase [Parabacteroides goldsteinii]|nr:histidine kinase [Parabacteroides goldsteinii]